MKYKLVLGLGLSVVIIAAFGFPMVTLPVNWYELPLVQGLGEKARIMFFHVPMAWVAVIAFISSLIYGILYLKKHDLTYDIKSSTAAGLGFVFCILATITGAIWAKFSWGAYWNWDPRQTSIFILLLIYGAYFALRSSIEVDEKKASLSAVYAIIAGFTVPFFVFIMPRVVSSLHPDPIINPDVKVKMSLNFLIIFLSSLAGFTGLYLWIFRVKVKLLQLEKIIKRIKEN